MANSRICSIPSCGKKHLARGWCSAHYDRFRIHGDPLGGGTAKGEALAFLHEAFKYEGDECLLWPFGHNGLGYGTIKIDGRTEYPHRLVCREVNGEPPDPSYEAAHSCGKGNEGCIAGRHLSWKTRLDNQSDRKAHGTHIQGERTGTSKLKEADVRRIRELVATLDQSKVAELYGVSQSLVSVIVTRKRWAWLD